ncbi:polygalacturonase inhibitor-like isoform X2 [Vigna radiata var. radiata]|uniref:Polygalacturonase inhibitor-like isoform X2 n=1 Tax=Vigna radiata var. radiata TaxID=3916 RepID=A0A3Q0EQV5_VIGRR|nr:polygalacturonase inhibitor-like isoform X2 [Vigna radiata var. radiata]
MTFLSQFSLLFLSLFYVFTFQNILCSNLSQLRCNEKDRQILQIFKEGLINSSNNLISWSTQQDCCQWQGVYCDNTSSRVTKLDLSYQSLQGSVPHAWKKLEYLFFISLWNNNLFGEVLEILSCWRYLEVINLEKNEFFGVIPNNMSKYLEVVILRSNKFEGSIPSQLFLLSALIHLDLAHNKLSGSIPQITYNITDMMVDNYSTPLLAEDGNIDFYQKGQVYDRELDLDRRTIDLSANKISGEIPSELFRLIRVQTLNLSYNHLTGTIPKTIGGMKNLESLDLSNNKLFGEIPENMATLTFLSYLNLSCNNFSGQIPIGTQLQSFSVSSYDGNPELCGDPLKKCSMKKIDVNRIEQRMKEDGEFDEESLYLGMGVGFAVGFCGLFGSLLSFRKWRHKYYRLLNRMYDQLYVTYMLKFNNFLNREALQ